jgi:hypothetical protein
MLADLESRLADVLGGRLPAPFAGRVFVAPGPSGAGQPALLVGVSSAEVLPSEFGSARRPEVVPGADDPRRVVRMRCTLRIQARASSGGGRPEEMAALDAVLYELDAGDLRDASALTAPGDPGFLLTRQAPRAVVVDHDDPTDRRLPAVVVDAEGWFWPPEVPGVTGEPIRAALVRMAQLPVALAPWPLNLRAGDPPVPLSIRVGSVGTMELEGGAPSSAPFGHLALRVLDAGGRPGAGSLTGGAAGPEGSRLVTVEDGEARVDYVPPAGRARDRLVVAVAVPDTGDGPVVGVELARFTLDVAP